ncbi:MAG: hypothetical protein QOF89_634 [Acidobacteriota bacterium]|jgi:hypothetical protein|nr:hypothetical protein [Acidobacteriota bacterium]
MMAVSCTKGTVMRLRSLLSLVVLLVGILISGPAWSDGSRWTELDPHNDCYAPQALHSPRATRVLLQQIFSEPERAGDLKSGSNMGGERVSGMIPRPEPKFGSPAPSWCTNRNNNYCTYAWDWTTRCCNPSYIEPGAYCPALCE